MTPCYPRAGFFRRLGAMLYDALLSISAVATVMAIVSAICMVLIGNGYIDITGYGSPADYVASQGWFQVLMLYVWGLFFVGFWVKGGQTLGMRAWRLRVQNEDGSSIHVRQAIVRVCFSLLGLGNLLVLVMPHKKLALQDRLADCEVVVLPKKGKKQPK